MTASHEHASYTERYGILAFNLTFSHRVSLSLSLSHSHTHTLRKLQLKSPPHYLRSFPVKNQQVQISTFFFSFMFFF